MDYSNPQELHSKYRHSNMPLRIVLLHCKFSKNLPQGHSPARDMINYNDNYQNVYPIMRIIIGARRAVRSPFRVSPSEENAP